VTSLTKAEVTERAVTAALPGKGVVHLAVHGLADEQPGSNLFAALVLLPTPGGKDTSDDGFLSLHEIYTLPLKDCELAVLSACVTNVGPQQPLEAGVTLAGGFLAAAVPTRGALRRLRELDPERAERLQPSLTRRGMRIVDTVVRFAEEREVPPAAVALGWLLTRPHIAAPVVTATSVEQVWAATAAAGVHLSRAEVTALDRASAE
jgi:hypothetical protein